MVLAVVVVVVVVGCCCCCCCCSSSWLLLLLLTCCCCCCCCCSPSSCASSRWHFWLAGWLLCLASKKSKRGASLLRWLLLGPSHSFSPTSWAASQAKHLLSGVNLAAQSVKVKDTNERLYALSTMELVSYNCLSNLQSILFPFDNSEDYLSACEAAILQ